MLKQLIKAVIKRTSFYCIIQNYRTIKTYWEWLYSGKPIPPPHIVKQMIVKEYANKYRVRIFIETGSYMGDMVYAVKDYFDKIYSIELDEKLFESAKNRFLNINHISILQGDSSKVLPNIIDQIKEPCLFWLDGHYSEGITAKGKRETPILDELQHIISHSVKDHIILIDDARLFTGQNDYPTLEFLRDLIRRGYPGYVFDVKEDIIRTHKNIEPCVT